MLNQFIIELEKRTRIDTVLSKFRNLFHSSPDSLCFSDEAFVKLLDIIESGGRSYLECGHSGRCQMGQSGSTNVLKKSNPFSWVPFPCLPMGL